MNHVRIAFGRPRWWQSLLGRGPLWERAAWAAVLLLGAIALVLTAVHAQQATRQRDQLQAALGKARSQAPRPAKPVARPVLSTQALQQFQGAVARLNVPWSDVLDVLERQSTPKVALLALESDSRDGNVALTIEARNLQDLLEFAQSLERDKGVQSVRLVQHEMRTDDPGQPVRMTLAFTPSTLRRQ